MSNKKKSTLPDPISAEEAEEVRRAIEEEIKREEEFRKTATCYWCRFLLYAPTCGRRTLGHERYKGQEFHPTCLFGYKKWEKAWDQAWFEIGWHAKVDLQLQCLLKSQKS